jgi:transposase-like protein
MAKGVPYDPKVKAEIVSKIRDGGQSVSSVSAEYGISGKSIYTWLREGVVGGTGVSDAHATISDL